MFLGTSALKAQQTRPGIERNEVVETINDFNNTYYGTSSQGQLQTSNMVLDNAGYASLLVYPNPTFGNARVVLPSSSVGTVYVDVVSLNGNVLRSYQYVPGSYLLNVDLSTLPASLYSVRVHGDDVGFYNLKVLKQ